MKRCTVEVADTALECCHVLKITVYYGHWDVDWHYALICGYAAVPVFTSSTSRLRNINVTDGDSVTFTCQTYAEPPATVVWLSNTRPLNGHSHTLALSAHDTPPHLTLFDVSRATHVPVAPLDKICPWNNERISSTFARGRYGPLENMFLCLPLSLPSHPQTNPPWKPHLRPTHIVLFPFSSLRQFLPQFDPQTDSVQFSLLKYTQQTCMHQWLHIFEQIIINKRFFI